MFKSKVESLSCEAWFFLSEAVLMTMDPSDTCLSAFHAKDGPWLVIVEHLIIRKLKMAIWI